MKNAIWLGSVFLLGVTLLFENVSPLVLFTSCMTLNSLFYMIEICTTNKESK